jgi:hypothetical protein
MTTYWFELNATQKEYLLELLNQIIDSELVRNNQWYNDFVIGVRYDLLIKGCLSENQLYQIKKLCSLTRHAWRLVI